MGVAHAVRNITPLFGKRIDMRRGLGLRVVAAKILGLRSSTTTIRKLGRSDAAVKRGRSPKRGIVKKLEVVIGFHS